MTNSEAGFDIDVDRQLNRVYLTQWGRLGAETAETLLDELDRKTARLPAGFDVLNDIRELKPFEQDDTDYIDRGRRIVSENGGAALVRVTGDSTISQMQFDRVVGDADYHVATAETPQQGERFLDRRREASADGQRD